jgi:hypothetical protein
MAIFPIHRIGLLHAKRARPAGTTSALASAGGSWTGNGIFTLGPGFAQPLAQIEVEETGWLADKTLAQRNPKPCRAIACGRRPSCRFGPQAMRVIPTRNGPTRNGVSRMTSYETIKKKT